MIDTKELRILNIYLPDDDRKIFMEAIDRLEAAEKDAAHQKALAEGALRVAEGWERKCGELRAKIEQMERQEPVGTLHDDGYFVWRKPAPREASYGGWKMTLYALPGAQGE